MSRPRKPGPKGRMRILIGYDGTPVADRMLRDLGRAALPAAAEVLLLSLVEPWARFAAPKGKGSGWPGTAALAQYREQLETLRTAAARKADRAAKALAGRFPGWRITALCELGSAAQAILDRSGRWRADLIVMGSHGRGLLGRAVLGSVSEKVVHHAASGVRISRAGTISRAYPPRILVAVDGSRASLAAARAAARRPWPAGTRVKLIGVIDPRSAVGAILGARGGGMPLSTSEARKWLLGKLAAAARQFSGPGIRPEPCLMEGDARHILLREAKAWKADGVFLGASGLSGIKRLLLGSVASALALHAPCSVEIVRAARA